MWLSTPSEDRDPDGQNEHSSPTHALTRGGDAVNSPRGDERVICMGTGRSIRQMVEDEAALDKEPERE
jgi:hypothetical protein